MPELERVQAGELLGQDDRIALGDDDHTGAQAQGRMTAGDVGEADDGLEDGAVLGLGRMRDEHVIGDPPGIEARGLGGPSCAGQPLDRELGTVVWKDQPEVGACHTGTLAAIGCIAAR